MPRTPREIRADQASLKLLLSAHLGREELSSQSEEKQTQRIEEWLNFTDPPASELTPPATPPPKIRENTFKFFSLPAEIRNRIYHLLLVRPDKRKGVADHHSPIHPAILRTCRLAHDEGISVLYGYNELTYTVRAKNPHPNCEYSGAPTRVIFLSAPGVKLVRRWYLRLYDIGEASASYDAWVIWTKQLREFCALVHENITLRNIPCEALALTLSGYACAFDPPNCHRLSRLLAPLTALRSVGAVYYNGVHDPLPRACPTCTDIMKHVVGAMRSGPDYHLPCPLHGGNDSKSDTHDISHGKFSDTSRTTRRLAHRYSLLRRYADAFERPLPSAYVARKLYALSRNHGPAGFQCGYRALFAEYRTETALTRTYNALIHRERTAYELAYIMALKQLEARWGRIYETREAWARVGDNTSVERDRAVELVSEAKQMEKRKMSELSQRYTALERYLAAFKRKLNPETMQLVTQTLKLSSADLWRWAEPEQELGKARAASRRRDWEAMTKSLELVERFCEDWWAKIEGARARLREYEELFQMEPLDDQARITQKVIECIAT